VHERVKPDDLGGAIGVDRVPASGGERECAGEEVDPEVLADARLREFLDLDVGLGLGERRGRARRSSRGERYPRAPPKTGRIRGMHAFGAAVEAEDIDGAVALLADDVVFSSPVVFKPYHGRPAVEAILRTVATRCEDFRYVRVFGADDAPEQALVFRARVGDRELEGCDFIHTRPDGLIDEFTVMVRPLSGALALAEAMRAKLAALQEFAG
jgi:limonene-1,2-epoxide hydrolase